MKTFLPRFLRWPLLCLLVPASALPAAPAPAPPPVSQAAVQDGGPWRERPVRLPPFFWYERDRELNRRLLMAMMLYWDVREEDTAHRLLLPVFYRWRDGDRSLLVSLPLVLAYSRPGDRWMVAGPFFRQSNDERTRSLFVPLYWRNVRAQGGRVTVALPFVFYDYRSRLGDRMDQVSLLGWRRRRGDRRMGLAANYFWYSEPENRFRVLFPLYWHGRSPEERFHVLGPLYFRWLAESALPAADAPAASTATVSGRSYAGLFPLLGGGWGGGVRAHYLFPLYYYARKDDRRSFVTLPFSVMRAGDGCKGHLGLYYYNRDPDLRVDGIFPFWMRRVSSDGFESKTQLLNFYSRRENEDRFNTLFPLYGYWSDPEGSRFLSWGVWRRAAPGVRSGWAYLYHWKQTDGGDRTRVLFPLYWHFRRPPDWDLDLVLPFYGRYRDGATTVTVVPPVVWRKSPERTSLSLFFLYWRDREKERGSTTFLPFFHDRFNPRRRMFFSPFLWTRRSALSREGVLPPAYWYRSAEYRRTIVFPVYWNVRGPDKGLHILPPWYRWRRGEVTDYGIFPLWGRRVAVVAPEGTSDDSVARSTPTLETRGSYLFPFYWHSGDGKGNGTWVIPPVLGFLSREGVGTDEYRMNFQYLLFGNVKTRKDALEHGFFPLYQYVRQGDFRNFWAPRGLALFAWERRGDFSKGFVFPYMWRRSPEKNWDLFLIWYHSSQFELTKATYTVEGSTAPREMRGARTGGASTLFPLYWSGRDPGRSYRYFIPLYASYREGARRFSAATPLWMSYDSPTGRQFRMFFPLYWRFLMVAKSPAAERKEGAPDRRQILVFGPWYRVDSWREDRKTRTVGLAPFFANTYTGPDDKYFELLGGLFGRDVQKGRRRFRLFYFFYTKPRALERRAQ